jgi:signal transduction histidine kinase
MNAEYTNEQYRQIEERARILAQEKSHLQLIIKMMNKLGELPGLENTVNTLIQLLLESIGGSNVTIYCRIDNVLHSTDMEFKDTIIDHLDDADVISVFDTKEFIEVIGDFENTKLLTSQFTKSYTWICPLLAGNELIGVIKIENLHIASIDFKNELPTFFNYAAIVLKNEILGYTKLKKAYDQLNESEKRLLKLNSEKDKFFSIIAHDLRGPFNGFLGLTQIMTEELDTLSKEDLIGMTKGLEKSASNLFCLLENLLHWARMQQGLIPFNPIGVQLLAVVNESIALLFEQAKIKGVDITVDISADISVFADINMLQTIIRNLVSNALKFTHKGGKVTISASTGDDSKVAVAIQDTGIGLSREMVDNLFRLDVQTSRPGTDGESSSGLGLLLCKEFVEKHGDKISVKSKEGKGSTFSFTIPCKA